MKSLSLPPTRKDKIEALERGHKINLENTNRFYDFVEKYNIHVGGVFNYKGVGVMVTGIHWAAITISIRPIEGNSPSKDLCFYEEQSKNY